MEYSIFLKLKMEEVVSPCSARSLVDVIGVEPICPKGVKFSYYSLLPKHLHKCKLVVWTIP